jgi:hypothetical protein
MPCTEEIGERLSGTTERVFEYRYSFRFFGYSNMPLSSVYNGEID